MASIGPSVPGRLVDTLASIGMFLLYVSAGGGGVQSEGRSGGNMRPAL